MECVEPPVSAGACEPLLFAKPAQSASKSSPLCALLLLTNPLCSKNRHVTGQNPPLPCGLLPSSNHWPVPRPCRDLFKTFKKPQGFLGLEATAVGRRRRTGSVTHGGDTTHGWHGSLASRDCQSWLQKCTPKKKIQKFLQTNKKTKSKTERKQNCNSVPMYTVPF